ncbi:MAG: GGDEF domain-containing protein [Myxococcota bacterium]|nr:GGDEF domain-containing protein [Myxococcota bacterium]
MLLSRINKKYPWLTEADHEQYRQVFRQRMAFINFLRARIISIVFFLLLIPLFIVDYQHKKNGLWLEIPGYRYLFQEHLVMLITVSVFWGLSYVKRPENKSEILPWHKGLVFGYAMALFCNFALISVTDQIIHGRITVFIGAIFGFSSFVFFRWQSLLAIFLVPSIIFFLGIPYFQNNRELVIGHFVNGSVFLVIGFIFSRTRYSAKYRDFVNEQIILSQKGMLEKLSLEDPLTGLNNRRTLETQLARKFAQAKRNKLPLTVAIADIDYFKRVNDTFFHQVGDEVLKIVAQIFTDNLREYDVVSRYGGEEFVVLLYDTSLEAGTRICERIRRAIETYEWQKLAVGLTVTISFGLSINNRFDHHEKMLSFADKKLYEAKQNGRNQIQA